MSGPTKQQLIDKLKKRSLEYYNLQDKYNELYDKFEPMRVQHNAMKNIHDSREHQLKDALREAENLRGVIAAMAQKIHGSI